MGRKAKDEKRKRKRAKEEKAKKKRSKKEQKVSSLFLLPLR